MRITFILLLLLSFVLFFSMSSKAIKITEIMYNPSGADSGREWIEINNNNSFHLNLEAWTFFEAGINHGLKTTNTSFIIPAGSYAIIADESETFLLDYPQFNAILFDSSWSSLSNSGELIAIKDNTGKIVHEVNYTTNLANGNGKSLVWFNNSWKESIAIGGSPGKQNNVTQVNDNNTQEQHENNETNEDENTSKGISISPNLDSDLFLGITYTSLFKIENLDHKTGVDDDINVTINYIILRNNSVIINKTKLVTKLNARKTANTGEFKSNETGQYIILGTIMNTTANDVFLDDNTASQTVTITDTTKIKCDIAINTTSENQLYNEGESIKFRNNLNNESLPYTIEYWVQDYFNTIYRNKINTTNTNQKSWKTNIDETDRALLVTSKVYPLCNDTNQTNNNAEFLFIVLANGSESTDSSEESESTLKITEAKDGKFGDILLVDVEVYKGDTRKQVIETYVKKGSKRISDITKIKIKDKFTSLEAEIPIQVPNNCNDKHKEGTYKIILEGLGDDDQESVQLSGKSSDCSISTKSSAPKSFIYEVLDFPEEIAAYEEFSTKVLLENNENKDLQIKAWSYVFRGPKSYSGVRDQNAKEITLKPGQRETIELSNEVQEADSGEYKLKVVINKNNQKTNKELTKDVQVIESQKSETVSEKAQAAVESPENVQPLAKNLELESTLIYESSSEKAKKLVIYFILGSSILLNIVLIFTKIE